MKEKIDCLLIGHNEMDFEKYLEKIKIMGKNSGAYRELNYDFVKHNSKLYTVPEIYNMFTYKEITNIDSFGPFSLGNVFSATIAYLATFLNRRGLTYDFCNSFQSEKEEVKEKLLKGNIRTIAITTTLYTSVYPILEIMSFIKKYNKSAKIIVGGPFIATQARYLDEMSFQILLKSIDADFYINSAQGEAALVKIIQAVKGDCDVQKIYNIAFKESNKYLATPIVLENNLLEENIVNWDLFRERIGKSVLVRTSISCPFSCSYCEYPQHAGKYQTMNVESLEKELDAINRIGSVSNVFFVDDTLNIPLDRFKEILRLIIKKKYKFKWGGFFRCQYTDRETAELLKESGCQGLYCGIESGNQKILNNMNKNVKLENYKKGITLLNEYSIPNLASFLVGFPGESEETVSDTIKFIEEYQPTFIRVHLWFCSKITPIWKEKDKYSIKGSQFQWSHTTMDSQRAMELKEHMYFSLKKSVYVPQYNFDFAGVINLLNRGMSLEQIKTFLTTFNDGIKEKLRNPCQEEVGIKVIERMRNACLGSK